MIHSLRIQNFKAIRDVEVSLERLTVFVGPNSSGKTSFLQGLTLFGEVLAGQIIGPLNDEVFSRGICSQYSDEKHIAINISSDMVEARLIIIPSFAKYWEHVTDSRITQEDHYLVEERRPHQTNNDWIVIEKSTVAENPSRLINIDTFSVGLAQFDNTSRALGYSIYDRYVNLPALLVYAYVHESDRFALIASQFVELLPIVKDIKIDPTVFDYRINRSESLRELEEKFLDLDDLIINLVNGSTITAKAASEGMLIILSLLSVLSQVTANQSVILLIDDLDRGLHPLAQRNVIGLLRRVLAQKPELQIVATTHSPYLVDSLEPEEVRMTTLNDDGTVACGRLVDHPKFERWKDEMAPGELWSMFGEKWVSQNPQAAEPL